jgi:hypothetical protein
MTTTGEVLIALVLLAIFAILACWVHYQLRLRSHQGMDRHSFVAHFVRLGVTPGIAGGVYDYYRSVVVWRNFSVSPDDDLDAVFGHVPEETASSLDAVLAKLQLTLPATSVLREHDRKLQTVSDVVNLVAWIEKHQDSKL